MCRRTRFDSVVPTYVTSSILFTISSAMYLIAAIRMVQKEVDFDSIANLISSVIYFLAYMVYSYECSKDRQSKDIPLIARPPTHFME